MTVHRSATDQVYRDPPIVLCGAKGSLFWTTSDRFADCLACLAIIKENRMVQEAEDALRRHSEADVNAHFQRVIQKAFKK